MKALDAAKQESDRIQSFSGAVKLQLKKIIRVQKMSLVVQVPFAPDTITELLDYLEQHNQQAAIPIRLETLVRAITETALDDPNVMQQILKGL